MYEKKITIMIVEDESPLRNHLVKVIETFTDLPVEVIATASTGIDAYDLVTEKMPDLVISDIKMPLGDGLSLAKKIHAQYPQIQVVLLSGYDEFTYAQEAIRSNVKEYLLKPVTTTTLHDTIERLVIDICSERQSLVINNASNTKEQICDSIISYLKKNFTKDISIAELSKKCGYTQEYLGKLFKIYTKQTISQYLIALRIDEAKRLLLKFPTMEIYKIAKMVGYKDNCFYFSRIFKAKTHLQPSEFRKSHQSH